MSKELNINIPLSIEGITVKQYREWIKVYESWDKEDEDYIKIKMLQIFCGLNPDETKRIRLSQFDNIINSLANILNQEYDLVRTFTMNGKNKDGEDVEVEFGFIPDLDDMTYGEWLDTEEYFSSWDNMNKLLSILYRPIYHKNKAGMYLIDEYEGTSRYSEVMWDAPANIALGCTLFFYRLGKKLSMLTLDFTQNALKNPDNQQTFNQASEEDGELTMQSIPYVKEMLRESMQLPKLTFTNA